MMVRALKTCELQSALDLIWRVFQEFEAPEYSEEGVKAFYKYIELNTMKKLVEAGEMKFLGAYEVETLIGVIGIKRGKHISMLFVDSAFHRKGIATALFEEAFTAYQGPLTVNSSPYALEFYHRLGFKDQAGEQVMDGIRFTPMKMEK